MSDMDVIIILCAVILGVASISYIIPNVCERHQWSIRIVFLGLLGLYSYGMVRILEGDISLWILVKVGLLFLFGWTLLVGATIDLQYHILPDIGALLLLVGGVAYTVVEQTSLYDRMAHSLVVWLIFYSLYAISDGGFGLGDVKWLAAIALWMPLAHMLALVCIAFTLGSLGVAVYRLCGTSVQGIPFGPCIALSSLLTILIGDWLIDSWWHILSGYAR